MYLQNIKQKKYRKKIFVVGIFKATDEKAGSGSASQLSGSVPKCQGSANTDLRAMG
jgi:hypothetical protein